MHTSSRWPSHWILPSLPTDSSSLSWLPVCFDGSKSPDRRVDAGDVCEKTGDAPLESVAPGLGLFPRVGLEDRVVMFSQSS